MSRAWVEGIIRESAVSFVQGSLGLWSARKHGVQLLIGLTGFRDFYTPPVLELFYAVWPSHWHRGFATEMAQAGGCSNVSTSSSTAACSGSFAGRTTTSRVT